MTLECIYCRFVNEAHAHLSPSEFEQEATAYMDRLGGALARSLCTEHKAYVLTVLQAHDRREDEAELVIETMLARIGGGGR
jgi:hypothetical protein